MLCSLWLHEISRLEILNTTTHKREINRLIEEGFVKGYDDPRLTTISGLRMRGVRPEAIREFVLKFGISKVETKASMEELLSCNRRMLDSSSKRLFFVRNPVKLEVPDVPDAIIRLRLHPGIDMGYREYECGSTYYIDGKDADLFEEGKAIRLKNAFSVRINKKSDGSFSAEYIGAERDDAQVVQWVAEGGFIESELTLIGDLLADGEFNKNSIAKVRGYAESYASGLNDGEVVQFERIGFFRFDKKGNTFLSL